MKGLNGRLPYITALVLTSIIWGSSFLFIKLSVSSIDGITYTFYRALISLLVLSPIGLLRPREINTNALKKGLYVGVSYILGLSLQGLGTQYTTPSISAFVTGLNTVFVYIYDLFKGKGKSYRLAISLVLSTIGLYLLTKPSGGLNTGVILILLGAVAWAAEIILVGYYSSILSEDLVGFLIGLLTPGLALAPYVIAYNRFVPDTHTLLYILYLSVFCTIIASFLQVLGQKGVPAHVAATIYLLEPVSALLFSVVFYRENIVIQQAAGAILIIAAIYIVTR
ncbi:DMT family transporter [Thermogladius sp. 4427co]|uniref:DMT family transporter n=1 Tax=Thermogladius sp. 4427co TaxID=3450718 RepID=UPI003F78E5A1